MNEIAYLPRPNEYIPDPPEPIDPEAAPARFRVTDTGVGERVTRSKTGDPDRGAARFTDVAALLAGGIPDPPRPLLLTRDDGHALLYAGQVNLLFGDAETGKTFIALAAISEAAKADRRVVFVDIDHNGADSVVARLLAMGVAEPWLSDPNKFRFIEPEDRVDLLDVIAFLRTWRPAVAVVDSVGELLPLLGRKSNDPDDFTSAHAEVLKPLAQAGAAVVAIDHLAKNTESRAGGPTGTAAKKRAIGGASIRVTVKDQFAPGYGGSAWLAVNKDRHGGLRAHCPHGDREPSAGLFTMTAVGDRILWNIKAPTGADAAALAGIPEADIEAIGSLKPEQRATVRTAREALSWRMDRASAALAAWRTRYPEAPGKQETPSVSVTQPPVSVTGNAETAICGHPPYRTARCPICLVADAAQPIFEGDLSC